MNKQKQLGKYLEELKDGLLSAEDILDSSEILSDPERQWLSDEFTKFIQLSNKRDQCETPLENVIHDTIDDTNKNPFTWGTPQANKVFTPIERGQFIVLAGSQNSGKTAFSFDLAVKNCKKHIVLYLSLEMDTEDILTRISRSYAGINKEEWRRKDLIPDEKREKYRIKKEFIRSLEGLLLMGLRGEEKTIENVFRIIQELEPDLIFVDNLDLLQNKDKSTVDHQSYVSGKFMDFCAKERFPVVLVHHMKKGGKGIDGIRGSGKITDDATGVFMCSRETDNYDQLDEVDRARFVVKEVKDRMFGQGGYHEYYFSKGEFNDTF